MTVEQASEAPESAAVGLICGGIGLIGIRRLRRAH
ncbi:MAG: PEP-CTERM sorting domain-containing protein [Bryobacteraceae bacterium]